jgi:Uma2 family endonuclease
MAPLTTTPRRVKLRVEDYLSLDAAGAFEAYGKTELLDGEVVYMNAQHRPHARIKSRLFRRLADALDGLGGAFEALVEGSISMPPYNVPEPDIAITAEPEGDGLIPLASLALVIEVADTTLRNDMGRKRKIYAGEGVPEYWVVDVKNAILYQMWSPANGVYANMRDVPLGGVVESISVVGLTIATDALA